jgi:hypothetical protein
MAAIAAAWGLDGDRLEADPGAPGWFLLARKPPGWDETGMMAGLAAVEPGPPR